MARDRSSPTPAQAIAKWLAAPATAAWLREHLGGRVAGLESVQTLWSGYGEIVRVQLENATVPSVIVKWVAPPRRAEHPRGWSGHASHQRKLRSYAVEERFYRDWCPVGASDRHRTATCHLAESTDDGWRFVLEDLDAAGFAGRRRDLRGPPLDQCLDWLASFHAHFVGRGAAGLWPIGTYWHLDTRADELAAMADPELRAAAPRLDAALNACGYQTLVHGDAKVANFCFGDNAVAAVDFQYVGGGCGIKDVAYFLSSCLSDAQCEAQAPRHLDHYFGRLRERLGPDIDADAVENEWRALYPAAWADFHRFLNGWAPDHWKIHRYTRLMTEVALAAL
ncbi:MAG: choline kinase [Planctomycetota bacterium]